ncbi:MAG TPA: deoxyguanosinetriphosphate triphosphohydrolase [bacterium]|nr:deoxyguanosinetriphosphate triphosphohydrolase [bacterium]
MKRTRLSYQDQEARLLAPYAIKSSETRGRQYPEKEHELRTPFQRDRDRIIHSTAFRRLQYKTQVFVNHEGDHYRTRLTHTLETSQIARSIARALRLNEDLVETVALAHDLGHGPFGHAGEWALEEIMKDHGGFEHNVHCLRIVEKLEDSYPDFPGLNLTFETREGLKKHPEHFYKNRSDHFRSLEAELVDLADEIAYNSHDLDDGLRAELLNESQLSGIFLWDESLRYIRKKYKKISDAHIKRLAIRLIINRQVTDVVETTLGNLKRSGIETLKDVQRLAKPAVGFSDAMRRHHAQLKKFLNQNLYRHYRVVRMTDKGQRFIKALFQVYLQKPDSLPPEVGTRLKKEGVHRAVCDHIAAMTDRFALDEYRRFFEPYERV